MRKVASSWLRKILLLLHQEKVVTRVRILEVTGLNHASVSIAVNHLLKHGVIMKLGDMDSRIGRKRELFGLHPEAGYFLGVDLESTRISFAVGNLVGDMRYRWEEDLPLRQPLDARVVFKGVDKLLRRLTTYQRSRVLAMGICYPGLLDPEGRLTAYNLELNGVPLLAEFTKLAAVHDVSDISVFLESDKRCSLLAEHCAGGRRDLEDALLLLVGRGIGLSVVVGGQLVEGWRGMAGEIGHMTVEPDAPDLCACGKRGCLEAVASSPNIVRQYLELTGIQSDDMRGVRVTHVYDKAREGDPIAKQVLRRVGRALGLALSHTATLLNPRNIILAGDIVAGEDVMLPIISEEMKANLLPATFAALELSVSDLGPDFRLSGAIALAFSHSLADPVLLHRMCNLKQVPGELTESAAGARSSQLGVRTKAKKNRFVSADSSPG